MCDFWSTTPIVGASRAMPARGACTSSYQALYSEAVSKICAEHGCQMPWSGTTTGSMMRSRSMMFCAVTAGTYCPATRMIIASRFSGVPPSQCCKDRMKVRASRAWSPGKNFRTLGNVRTNFSSPSWKLPPPPAFLPCPPNACCRTSLTCWAKEPRGPPVMAVKSNDPSLFSFITSGMEGKQRQMSRRSRTGWTTSTSFSANSCTKIREQMKAFASCRSPPSSSKALGSRISSSK
mmetsp:Transcript_94248/g.288356  ORF Transcript_94248/g.288356 Transcript_94248/m.288356 type:complete len:235 (-) Transcript_94248:133-837(-)